jgi:hypothetical protein
VYHWRQPARKDTVSPFSRGLKSPQRKGPFRERAQDIRLRLKALGRSNVAIHGQDCIAYRPLNSTGAIPGNHAGDSPVTKWTRTDLGQTISHSGAFNC